MAANSNGESQHGDDSSSLSYSHIGTAAVHGGYDASKFFGWPVTPPISMATTFKQSGPNEHHGYDYTRAGNPTREVTESNIASLENAKYCSLFSSGLSSLNALVLSLVKTGDHIICNSDVYGGTNRYLRTIISNFGVTVDFVDLRDLKALENLLRPTTKLVIIETPTNPMIRIIDIRATCDFVRSKVQGATVAVDNTFASPFCQRPLALGADVVWHSCTKYLNGHSDVLMGALCTNDEKLAESFRYQQKSVGAVPSPFDCYLLWRGLKTLHVRMQRHEENARALAAFLSTQPLVKSVLYPGLPTHPEYERACKQMRGFSGMLSFCFVDTVSSDLVTFFLKSLKILTIAESLGTVETLIQVPSLMTHASVPPEQRAALGMSDQFVRMSVGIEEAGDLIADIRQGFEQLSAKIKQA